MKRGSLWALSFCLVRLARSSSVYPVEPQAKLAQFVAEDVRVTGEMVNGTIQIHSIALKRK
jgi:hypothetical protein